MRKTLIMALAAGVVWLGMGSPTSATKPNPSHKVWVCHATSGKGELKNGYNLIHVDVASVQFVAHLAHATTSPKNNSEFGVLYDYIDVDPNNLPGKCGYQPPPPTTQPPTTTVPPTTTPPTTQPPTTTTPETTTTWVPTTTTPPVTTLPPPVTSVPPPVTTDPPVVTTTTPPVTTVPPPTVVVTTTTAPESTTTSSVTPTSQPETPPSTSPPGTKDSTPPSATSGRLPETGSEWSAIAIAGAFFLALGGLALTIARRP